MTTTSISGESRGATIDEGRWLDTRWLAQLCSDMGPDMSGVMDPEGVLRYIGGDAERLLGEVPHEQIGTMIWEFV
ncbi:MAG: hypothetical protein ACYC2O_08760, partial [Microthrixaceae bacterium]